MYLHISNRPYAFYGTRPENVIKLAKGSLNNISQDSFNKILFEQLTHERSYVGAIRLRRYIGSVMS